MVSLLAHDVGNELPLRTGHLLISHRHFIPKLLFGLAKNVAGNSDIPVISLFELSLLLQCTVQMTAVARHIRDASLISADLAPEIPGFVSPSTAGTRLQVRSR